jgi:integral membrane protein
MMLATNIGRLRLLAYLEGISFILLIGVGMPLKYYHEMPGPNLYIGMIHGVLFISYCLWVMIVRSEQQWNLSKTFWALLASFVPLGTFVADVKLFKPARREMGPGN